MEKQLTTAQAGPAQQPDITPAAQTNPAQQPNPAPATARVTPALTQTQRWLLLAVLPVGIMLRLGWGNNPVAAWSGWPGLFWLVAMAAVTPFIWKRVVQSRTGMAVGIAAIALCVLQIVHGYRNDEVAIYRMLAMPMMMMLYLVFGAYDIPAQREGEAAKLALSGVFVYPFTGVPRFFAAIFSLFRNEGRARGLWKRVLLGLAAGLVVAAGVLVLLMQADANMDAVFGGLLNVNWATLQSFGNSALIVLGAAMLFYGVFERAARSDKPALPAQKPACWPASTMAALLAPPLFVYAVFVVIQFGYLFGGVLPKLLTYSTYARQGFTEMNFVVVVNFTLFGLTQRYAKRHRLLTVHCALLLCATAGIVVSAGWRLLLYIGAYGLTINRILPLWLSVFLLAITVLCAVRLYRNRFPVLRIGGITFLYWFVLLNIPNWDAIIRAYNSARGVL